MGRVLALGLLALGLGVPPLFPQTAADEQAAAKSYAESPADPAAPPAGVATPSPDAVKDLAGLIGLDVEEAYTRLGPPREVFPLRGQEPWQDDVVFLYPGHLHLFWYDGHVWQARLDGGFSGEVFGLRMGATRVRVREVMGPPWREQEDALVYHLEDRGFPVRLAFYFEGELLSDVYCYRGDL
jgi:hypothetical protein